jgi:endogenous inhibitor of DNA gyrase (YacG/DUF329 family)
MLRYTVSFESDDHTGTAWFDVEADDALDALTAAAAMFGEEYGQPGARCVAEAFPISVPVVLADGEIVHCGNCGKPVARGFAVCSKECAAEVNEVADPESRIMRHDYPSKSGIWLVCWRNEERGFRACYVGRNPLYKPELDNGEYDEQRPLIYDDRLYPAEAPALARAEELNGAEVLR